MSALGNRTRRVIALALATPALLLVSACGSGDDTVADGTAEVDVNQTVLALLRDDDNLSSMADLVERTGLNQVLDAAPSYTLLAPTNDALSALSPADGDDADDPAMAALLRGHMLPGYVTLDDIKAAIAADDDNSVTMQTMAQTPVTFTQEGDTVTVTAADGASATLGNAGLQGGNGVILPIGGVLKTL